MATKIKQKYISRKKWNTSSKVRPIWPQPTISISSMKTTITCNWMALSMSTGTMAPIYRIQIATKLSRCSKRKKINGKCCAISIRPHRPPTFTFQRMDFSANLRVNLQIENSFATLTHEINETFRLWNHRSRIRSLRAGARKSNAKRFDVRVERPDGNVRFRNEINAGALLSWSVSGGDRFEKMLPPLVDSKLRRITIKSIVLLWHRGECHLWVIYVCCIGMISKLL